MDPDITLRHRNVEIHVADQHVEAPPQHSVSANTRSRTLEWKPPSDHKLWDGGHMSRVDGHIRRCDLTEQRKVKAPVGAAPGTRGSIRVSIDEGVTEKAAPARGPL